MDFTEHSTPTEYEKGHRKVVENEFKRLKFLLFSGKSLYTFKYKARLLFAFQIKRYTI
ncbi:MAG: hypothetical protein H5T38_05860 [Methanobacteriaceae archaeon]|nr:hypothetical protein [Methanobacteriaceae archaeon]